MPKLERKLLDAVIRYLPYILFGVAVAFSLYARICMLPVVGTDMSIYLLPWSEELAAGGAAALAQGVGIYSVVLQLVLWLSALLPIETVTAIKLFSIVGDYVMALGAMLLVLWLRPKEDRRRRGLAMLAFAGVALLPLPLLNSAFWGQSEALYAAPALLAVYFLLKEKYAPAFLLYGLALGVKLQAILLLPLFVMVYFVWRRFSALWFLLPPAVVFVTTLPAVLAGAPLGMGWRIYADLTRYDQAYFINYPGLPALSRAWFGNVFTPVAIGLALVAMLAMLTWLCVKRRLVQGENLLLLAAWCVLACTCILPGMHERYAYVGELLLWVWFFVRPSLRRGLFAVLFTFTAYCAYVNFLLSIIVMSFELLAIVNLAGLVLLTLHLAKTLPAKPLHHTLEDTP